MEKLTRRLFFKQASLGVATTGMLAAAPTLATVATETPEAPAAVDLSATTLPETLIAHVRDASTGEVSLLVGTKEIIYRDSELVMRLLKAVH